MIVKNHAHLPDEILMIFSLKESHFGRLTGQRINSMRPNSV
jgi:hypothetical protein